MNAVFLFDKLTDGFGLIIFLKNFIPQGHKIFVTAWEMSKIIYVIKDCALLLKTGNSSERINSNVKKVKSSSHSQMFFKISVNENFIISLEIICVGVSSS